MSRNGSGNYSLPEPPFVPLTTISSAAMNSDLSDIASALTASLARDGQGGMTAVLPLNTAGFSYTSDTNTGMYRTGSDAQAIKCGGTDIVAITSSGIDVTGAVKQNGSTLLPVGLGPLPWSLATAPAGWALAYGQPCTSTYAAYRAALIADGSPYGNNGTDPLFPDMRGNNPVGKTNMGGVASSNLTSTFFTGTPTTLGATGGVQSVALVEAQNGPHAHSGTTGTESVLHTHDVPNILATSGANGTAGPSGLLGNSVTRGSNSQSAFHTHDFVTNSSGSGTPHTNVQPGLILNYIVFVGV